MSTDLLDFGWQRPHITESTVLSASSNLTYYGQFGATPGMFYSTNGICFSNNGLRLIVADANNNRLQVFSVTEGVNLTYQTNYGTAGSGAGNYSYPMSVACHPTTSHVFVADNGNNRIHVLTLTVDTLSSVGYYGSYGSDVGQFKSPTGVAVSGDGARLAVSDFSNYRVQIFGIGVDGTLTPEASFGVQGYANGQFYGPRGVAFSKDGSRLAVAEDTRVRWLRVDGNILTNITDFAFPGGGSGTGVDISRDGSLMIVSDTSNHRVLLVRISNDKLTRIAGIGSKYLATATYGELSNPIGVALHPDGVHIAISDDGNKRIVTL